VFWKSEKKIRKKGIEKPSEQLAMPPERADLVLPSNIPDGEGNVLVFDGLDIETLSRREGLPQKGRSTNGWRTDCGDSGDDFTELELVENSGFSSGIKTDLYYSESDVMQELIKYASYHENT
jgi:hypothetical protein